MIPALVIQIYKLKFTPPIPFPKLVWSVWTEHRSLVHALWWLPAFCQETRAPEAMHGAVWLDLDPQTGRRAVLGQVRRAGLGRRQQTGLRGPGPTCPRCCVGHPPPPPLRSPACAEATSAPGWGVGILTCMGREHMLVSTSFRASEYSSLPKSLVRLFWKQSHMTCSQAWGRLWGLVTR